MILGTIKEAVSTIDKRVYTEQKVMEDIKDIITNSIGIPENADFMDCDLLYKTYLYDDIDHFDLMDALVETTNALIDIQKLIKVYEESEEEKDGI